MKTKNRTEAAARTDQQQKGRQPLAKIRTQRSYLQTGPKNPRSSAWTRADEVDMLHKEMKDLTQHSESSLDPR